MIRAAVIAVVGLASIVVLAAVQSVAPAAPRVLIFSKTAGFRHDSIPEGIACVKELGTVDAGTPSARTVFECDATEDASAFTSENLAKYRGVVFLSTSGDVLDDKQQVAFERWVNDGGGFVGIHAAADTEHSWPWYGEQLIGAWFKTHPAVQKATVKVEDRTHVSTRMLPERWERVDEWYVYDRNPRAKVHVLATVDESTYDAKSAVLMGDHPIAWCREIGNGRSWYTGGGHTKECFSEALFRAHIAGGIRWALRLDANEAPREPAPVAPAVKPAPPKPATKPTPTEPNPDGDPLSHPAPRE